MTRHGTTYLPVSPVVCFQREHGRDVVHEMQLAYMLEEVIPTAPSRRYLMRHFAAFFRFFFRGRHCALESDRVETRRVEMIKLEKERKKERKKKETKRREEYKWKRRERSKEKERE